MDGWEISRVRRRIDVSQENLAYLLGVSPCTIVRYERGHSRPDGLVLDLLRALDIATRDPLRAPHVRAQLRDRSERLAIIHYVLNTIYGEVRNAPTRSS